MMRLFYLLVVWGLIASEPVLAGTIKYYQDPVYKQMNADDPHPMTDLTHLAEDGDVRAQYILGDLYAKGKGGLAKDEAKGADWFDQSARNGYYPSFFRLAALAKHNKKYAEAYKWYSLAVQHFRSGPDRSYAVQARDAVLSEQKLTQEQIKQAKKAVEDWNRSRATALREQKAQEKAEAARARAAERKQAEQKKIDAAKPPKDPSLTTLNQRKDKSYNE